MRIIHIQLYRMKQVRHLSSRTIPPINQIFALPPNQYLSCHIHLFTLLVSHGRRALILIVKYDCDGGLVDTSLALFVYQFGEVSSADLREVLDSEDETDGVENIGFTGAI